MICARGETGLVPTRAVHNSASTGNLSLYYNNRPFLRGVELGATRNATNVQNVGGSGNGRDGFDYRRAPNERSDEISYAILTLQRQVDMILSRMDRMEGKLNQNLLMVSKVLWLQSQYCL
jgi:hypothetical protein